MIQVWQMNKSESEKKTERSFFPSPLLLTLQTSKCEQVLTGDQAETEG